MDGLEFFDALDFDDNFLLDQQIEAVGGWDRDSLVSQGDLHLGLDLERSAGQFEGETVLVGALEETWAQWRRSGDWCARRTTS